MPVEQKVFGKTPFTMTNEMKRKVGAIVSNVNCEIKKAEAIFDWMRNNIEYDYNVREGNYFYKPAHYVYYTKKGVCLDQSYLYTGFAREIGLESYVALINLDENDSKVYHACSTLFINGDIYFIDPAQNKFDAMHKKYNIVNDRTIIDQYYSFLHSYEPREGGFYKKSEDLEQKILKARSLKINEKMIIAEREYDAKWNEFELMLMKVSGFSALAYIFYKMGH